MTQAAMSGVPLDLLTHVTTGTGTAIAIPPSFKSHTFIIQGKSTVSAGAVQLETANDPNYAGVWAAVPKLDGTASTPITVVDGADIIFQSSGVLNFVRARVTTNVTGGGDVTVTYEGFKLY